MSSDALEAADRMHSAAIHLLRRVHTVDAEMGVSRARVGAVGARVRGAEDAHRARGRRAVTPPTMSKLVGAMEREGLVRREQHESDGRAIILRATPKARRILERGRERRVELQEALLVDAGGPEIAAVRRAAAVLARAVSG
jgi:DNA-binding MarR family transcriptional regulator